MEEQATDGLDVTRHDSQQDELRMPSGHANDVTREAVLSHTGEVFEALQQKASPQDVSLYRSGPAGAAVQARCSTGHG